MISILKDFPNMIKTANSFSDSIKTGKKEIKNIIIAGMGGSGYNGDLLKTYLKNINICLRWGFHRFPIKTQFVTSINTSIILHTLNTAA